MSSNGEPEFVLRYLKDGTEFTVVLYEEKTYVTMETAGILVGYEFPRQQISQLYMRRKEELDDYITEIDLISVDNKVRKHKCFDRQGFNLLCMFADTETAKARRKEILEIMNDIETNEFVDTFAIDMDYEEEKEDEDN
jgi:hypothetical protein